MKNLTMTAQKVINEFNSIGLFPSVQANQFRPMRKGSYRAEGITYYKSTSKIVTKVTINQLLLADNSVERSLEETIAHELVHCLPDCIGQGHNAMFKKYANFINGKLGYHISRLGDEKTDYTSEQVKILKKSKDNRKKYVFYCKTCGKECTPYYRKSNIVKCFIEHHEAFMNRFCCPYCKKHNMDMRIEQNGKILMAKPHFAY